MVRLELYLDVNLDDILPRVQLSRACIEFGTPPVYIA